MRYDDIVIATHNPLVGLSGFAGATLFQTKLALYTSYVDRRTGAERRSARRAVVGYQQSRTTTFASNRTSDFDVVIFGGEDHKTGQQEDTENCYRRLEDRLTAIVPRVELTHRWSGQVIETPDGLPYIGQSAEHQYAATGYAGNGLTFGTLAGHHDLGRHPRTIESLGGAVRSEPEGPDPRTLGLPQGERRLSVLHDSRPLRGTRGAARFVP